MTLLTLADITRTQPPFGAIAELPDGKRVIFIKGPSGKCALPTSPRIWYTASVYTGSPLNAVCGHAQCCDSIYLEHGRYLKHKLMGEIT